MFLPRLSNYKIHAICLVVGVLFASDGFALAQEEDAQQESVQQADSQSPNTAGAAASEFNLQASVMDGPELSRSELKRISPDRQTAPAAEQAVPAPEPTAVTAAMPPGMTGSQEIAPQQSGAVPLQAGAAIHEYGVDWSSWMSQVADRWYFQLRRLEAQSPYEFYTDGPAQIEFTCYPNGQVGNVILRRSCGVPVYDRMQIQALLLAVPMPPFPRGTQRTSYTLCQGWEAHSRRPGESDYQPGSFGRNTPVERVQQWD